MKRSKTIFYKNNKGNFLLILILVVTSLMLNSCSKNTNNGNSPQQPQQPQTQQLYDVKTLGARLNHTVYDQIALQPGGKLIALRYDVAHDTLVRLLESGEVDSQFNIFRFGTDDYISELLVQTDGKILLLGKMPSRQGNPALIRLSANGQFEKNLITTIGSNTINCMMLQPDGKILIGGSFSSAQGSNKLIRISNEGVLDVAFKSPFSLQDGAVMFLTMDSQSRILAGGKLPVTGDAIATRDAVRLKTDGSIDQTFNFREHVAVPQVGSVFPTIVRTIAVDKQDRVFIGGDFLEVQSPEGVRTQCNNLVRIQANGTLDKEFIFSSKAPGRVTAILPLSNGDVIVGRNWASIILGYPNECVNLCGPKGEDRDLQLGFHDGFVNDIIQETAQKILVSGGFNKSPSPEIGLCRLTQK